MNNLQRLSPDRLSVFLPLAQRLAKTAIGLGLTGLLCGFGAYRPGALSPESLGMGDAMVAAATGTTAVIANPAGLSQVPLHTLETGLSRNPVHGRSTVFVATADGSSPSGISAGILYAWDLETEIDGIKRSGSDMRVGFGAALGGNLTKLYLGGTVRRLGLTCVDAKDHKRTIDGWTGDVGAIFSLNRILRIGVVYRNIIERDPVETPARLASGVSVFFKPVILSADVSWGLDGGGTSWHAGSAVMIGDSVQLRAGWSQDGSLNLPEPLQRAHAGLGWRFGSVGFQLGGAVNIHRPKEVLFSGALTFYLPYTAG